VLHRLVSKVHLDDRHGSRVFLYTGRNNLVHSCLYCLSRVKKCPVSASRIISWTVRCGARHSSFLPLLFSSLFLFTSRCLLDLFGVGRFCGGHSDLLINVYQSCCNMISVLSLL